MTAASTSSEATALGPDERREALISYRLGDMHAPALSRSARRSGNVMAEFAGAIAERQAAADRRAHSDCASSTLLEAASLKRGERRRQGRGHH